MQISRSLTSVADLPVETVERKGFGHPDTLADGIAEAVSQAFSKACLEGEPGAVLHHNVDKVYIGAGHIASWFGGHEVREPVVVRINGRMSSSYGGTDLGIEDIQIAAATEYLSVFAPHYRVGETIRIEPNATQHTKRPHWFTPRDLADVPDAKEPRASDTALCVAHAPLSPTEYIVRELEYALWDWSGEHPVPRWSDVGQDVKVFAWRTGRRLEVTACVPLLSDTVASLDAYLERIRHLEGELQTIAERLAAGRLDVRLRVNPVDTPQGHRCYMLALGSCIECGEEGVVGRGNGWNGLISPLRPRSMESPFGKNPAYHTGKVYGQVAQRLADDIHQRFGVACSVWLSSPNGYPLLPPHNIWVELPPGEGPDDRELEAFVQERLQNTQVPGDMLVRRYRP
ncbi:methionine adenosyltransferase [Streptomyces sp. NPDC048182]|uniref:methionine adenosyltransferase n=1 Tax=Streptomyces sp. NPDC048182 TaxID=3365507 RepID=UPI00371E0971